MNCFSRLVLAYTIGSFTLGGAAFAAEQHVTNVQDTPALLGHSSQSYLGVYIRDIDNNRAADLKLKEATGAEIIAVDRDGPAGKAGLRAHDVILQMNGQPVAGEEQLRRMLHETPPGRTINLVFSRDGQQQALAIQLADRDTIEQNSWAQHMVVPAPEDNGDGYILEGPSGNTGNSFLGAFSLGSSSVGLDLDVLGSQLADYFGVKNGQGLLVKHVADNSPAAKAGLKAGDVITTANGQTMATVNEWMKMLHANKGKQVQVTLVRNHKEQTVTLDAGNGKSHGELIEPGDLDGLSDVQLEKLDTQLAQLKVQIDPEVIQQQVEKAEKSVDWTKLQQQLKEQNKQLDQQMQQLQKSLKTLQLYQMD